VIRLIRDTIYFKRRIPGISWLGALHIARTVIRL
jgi:hypothetical protein